MDRKDLVNKIINNSIGRICGTRIHPQDIQQIFMDLLEYVDEQITALAGKIERVELECEDDQHIVLKGSTQALSYAQIKALVDDNTKFVTLRYLNLWWMLPAYDDGGAIMFTSSDIEGGHAVTTRVVINEEGQMNNYSIICEDADHKTDDMSVEVAADGHDTYPTTKAVKDYVDSKLG